MTDEFLADIMAAYLAGDPVIAKDLFLQDIGGVISAASRRDISEVWLYPVENPEDPNHDPGRPFSGAMWDLRNSLISSFPADGADIADQLFFGLMELYRERGAHSPLSPAILLDVLTVDNDLFNPTPGTFAPPHEQLIKQVFDNHNIHGPFLRGDSNSDCVLNLSDIPFTLNYLFAGGPEPQCHDAADADDSAELNITDGIFLFNYLFRRGPATPEPRECPGVDPAPQDQLTCLDVGCATIGGCP